MLAAVASPAALSAAPLPRPPAFAMCGVCHKTVATEKSVLGPNLWGVGGRKAGTMPGFAYSPAMQRSGIVWNRDALLAFVTAPQAKVPGTKMAYGGQKDPKVAGAIVDYVLSLK
ncbi:c-type cytochrome [Sphingomonas profundi]|uniref:c-type cytochrome n=1 Tax=Alterirhizorhabdus profundi TaxID=2681549 RepID=UPI001E4150DB|nr:cytochrome C [Sphingomonas profundi]